MAIPSDSEPGSENAPLRFFKFCPQCAAPAAADDPARRFACAACGFTLYANVGGAYGGLIVDDQERVLMVRRAKDPGKGLLAVPGGFADPGETAEEGLQREVFEEVGLRVEITDYLTSHPNPYTYRGITYPVLDLFYVCRVVGETGELTLQESEIAGYEWRPLRDLHPEEIAFPSQRHAIDCYRRRNGVL